MARAASPDGIPAFRRASAPASATSSWSGPTVGLASISTMDFTSPSPLRRWSWVYRVLAGKIDLIAGNSGSSVRANGLACLTFFRSAARGLHVPAELTPESTKREARKRRASERPRLLRRVGPREFK